jgi:hypothetical protein
LRFSEPGARGCLATPGLATLLGKRPHYIDAAPGRDGILLRASSPRFFANQPGFLADRPRFLADQPGFLADQHGFLADQPRF